MGMKVLLLSPYPEFLTPALEATGDTYRSLTVRLEDEVAAGFKLSQCDFIVSFGYRHIISGKILNAMDTRIINIHISFLPWNRGSDPNFWSWFDDTPKGVTIHRIDQGLDTGNIIVQQLIRSWPQNTTLKSSHERLMMIGAKLFADNWRNLRRDGLGTRAQDPRYGSAHKKADKDRIFNELPLGWDTPVKYIRKLGSTYRELQHAKENRNHRPRKHRQPTLPEL
jgi:methionyl-tRNA formyltransferase